MKKYLAWTLLIILLVASVCYAGEKEEIQLRLENVNLRLKLIECQINAADVEYGRLQAEKVRLTEALKQIMEVEKLPLYREKPETESK